MDDLKKKVAMDMLASPSTLVPIGGGLAVLMAALANSGPWWLFLLAAASLIGGVGWLWQKFCGLDKRVQKAWGKLQVEKEEAKRARIQDLTQRAYNLKPIYLVAPRSGRSRVVAAGNNEIIELINNLNGTYSAFQESMKTGHIAGLAKNMASEPVAALYEACVKKLEYVCKIHEMTAGLSGSAQKMMLDRRLVSIKDVSDSVDQLAHTIDQCLVLTASSQEENDMSGLRGDLEKSMEIAKNTDDRMREINSQSQLYMDKTA